MGGRSGGVIGVAIFVVVFLPCIFLGGGITMIVIGAVNLSGGIAASVEMPRLKEIYNENIKNWEFQELGRFVENIKVGNLYNSFRYRKGPEDFSSRRSLSFVNITRREPFEIYHGDFNDVNLGYRRFYYRSNETLWLTTPAITRVPDEYVIEFNGLSFTLGIPPFFIERKNHETFGECESDRGFWSSNQCLFVYPLKEVCFILDNEGNLLDKSPETSKFRTCPTYDIEKNKRVTRSGFSIGIRFTVRSENDPWVKGNRASILPNDQIPDLLLGITFLVIGPMIFLTGAICCVVYLVAIILVGASLFKN